MKSKTKRPILRYLLTHALPSAVVTFTACIVAFVAFNELERSRDGMFVALVFIGLYVFQRVLDLLERVDNAPAPRLSLKERLQWLQDNTTGVIEMNFNGIWDLQCNVNMRDFYESDGNIDVVVDTVIRQISRENED